MALGPERCQYYLHNFLTSQPDLNFHQPGCRPRCWRLPAFWLARGIDGFRLDVVNFYHHDLAALEPAAAARALRRGRAPDNPYAFQRHLYNKTQPENLGFLTELRG